jgi:hypothetical protein
MFRTEEDKKFGVGTLVLFGNDQKWLLIEEAEFVMALNLNTLEVDGKVAVKQTDWISRLEFERIFDFSGCTFSDFTLYPCVKVTEVNQYKY